MLIVFSFTLFLSALLLFCIQFAIAKSILPLLGGSPSVWNTTQFFFQTLLLFGYGYSYLISRWLSVRRQAIAHTIILIIPLFLLPIAIDRQWIPPSETNPIPSLLGLLFTSVGLPFFVVSTTAPLLQKWFSCCDRPDSEDPYFLYAASNCGSVLGLLGYPAILEPNLTLNSQYYWWAIGYGVLIALIIICGFYLIYKERNSSDRNDSQIQLDNSETPPSAIQQARWVILAFIPSSLLLGVTTYLTTDLAAIPLLWAIPLTLYLTSFILTFSRRLKLPHFTLIAVLPLFLSIQIILDLAQFMRPLWLTVPLHLTGFFVAACVFHGELVRDRPSPQYLTTFYLWISVGGVLGGWFNAIAAPLIFPTVLEYPLILLLAILILRSPDGKKTSNEEDIQNTITNYHDLEQLLTQRRDRRQQQAKLRYQNWCFNLNNTRRISLSLLFGASIVCFSFAEFQENLTGYILFSSVLLISFKVFKLSKNTLILGLIFTFLIGQFYIASLGGIVASDRSFFGINRVVYDREENYRSLLHGTTLHGKQSLDPKREREPLTYFYPTGAIGQMFEMLNRGDRLSDVAVLGLGIGTLAAYAEAGETWTFYEIDPIVVEFATNSDYFTFLKQSDAPFTIVLGDGRLNVAKAPDRAYDLLVMDAFSSDSIPVHLVTQEAIDLYFRKLRDRGILAINISNRFINLAPVLGAIARELNLVTLQRVEGEVSELEKARGKSPSNWVLLARDRHDFGELVGDANWEAISLKKDAPVWTDNFSNLLSVLRIFHE
jgi:spermidine synthase